MNTEQLKQAALNGDPDAASPATILALRAIEKERAYSPSGAIRLVNEYKDCARAALQKADRHTRAKIRRCGRLRRRHPSKGEAVTKETDRELLELAAKAAGYVIQEYRADGSAWVYPVGEIPDEDGDYDGLFLWRPRADDGDALRLAVKLRLDFYTSDTNGLGERIEETAVVYYHRLPLPRFSAYEFVSERFQHDPQAATRRAIVRAAAKIGRAMP